MKKMKEMKRRRRRRRKKEREGEASKATNAGKDCSQSSPLLHSFLLEVRKGGTHKRGTPKCQMLVVVQGGRRGERDKNLLGCPWWCFLGERERERGKEKAIF